MRQVILPRTGTDSAWRDAARGLLAQDVPAEDVLWHRGTPAAPDLFAADAPPAAAAQAHVPRSFLALARDVVWHSEPERFARLYALLRRVVAAPHLMADRGDAALAHLHRLAKEVRRDKHKMTAFLRFREVEGSSARRRFAAWFEPSHFIAEPTAEFFANRFGDMDWLIVTPDLSVTFEQGRIGFADGGARPPLPEDATEELWRTYFQNIFNPARLKVQAMQAEMPKKYWRNLPEADLIPQMIASAQTRARAMAEAAPTLPPARAPRITRRLAEVDATAPRTQDQFEVALEGCRRCPLWKNATQAVPGEGPLDARVMIVGEQPGDREDLEGRPLVGPAGQLFDTQAQAAGLVRARLYLTNAVKHFKFTPRGRRRIHQSPSRGEVSHCRWWLDLERERVQPRLIVAMGATAALALTGDAAPLAGRRGRTERAEDGTPVLITWHPSYLLRLEGAARARATAEFTADLAQGRAANGGNSPFCRAPAPPIVRPDDGADRGMAWPAQPKESRRSTS